MAIHTSSLLQTRFPIFTLDEVDQTEAKKAVERINALFKWSHDNEEIFSIFEKRPKYCLFAKNENDLVGYAILRDDGEDKHLHVSWIATDKNGVGIGSELMHRIIEINRALGKKQLTLHHRNDNEKVKRFYQNVAEKESVVYQLTMRNDQHCRVTYLM